MKQKHAMLQFLSLNSSTNESIVDSKNKIITCIENESGPGII